MHNIRELLSKKPERIGNTKLIAIDGYAGCGKSSLATWLAKQLHAEIIHVDDFATWDQEFPWHNRLIDEVLIPIQNKASTLSYERTSWWENHHPEKVTNQPVTAVMILEGVRALRPELRHYISLSILVSAPKDICMERGIARDLNTGKSLEEISALWKTWQTNETTYMGLQKPQIFADITLDGTIPFETQLSF
ncbi:MAG: hypothetical protein RLZZ76_769 [Candidatus Parcubacteria bacterium]|jgi:uridine kinase